jgi:hypothetical protein
MDIDPHLRYAGIREGKLRQYISAYCKLTQAEKPDAELRDEVFSNSETLFLLQYV